MPKRIATWNPARGAWETDQQAVCGHWEPYSLTWPTSGTTLGGTAYALPTSAPLTDDSGCSSSPGLLPTPNTQNGRESGRSRDVGADLTARLLSTPQARDYKGLPADDFNQACLVRDVLTLLPTPRATDGTNGGPNQRGSSGDLMLPSAVQLLPTPTAQAAKHSADDRGPGTLDDCNLWSVAARLAETLLPTPTSRDWKDTGDFTPHPEKTKLPHSIAALAAVPLGGEG